MLEGFVLALFYCSLGLPSWINGEVRFMCYNFIFASSWALPFCEEERHVCWHLFMHLSNTSTTCCLMHWHPTGWIFRPSAKHCDYFACTVDGGGVCWYHWKWLVQSLLSARPRELKSSGSQVLFPCEPPTFCWISRPCYLPQHSLLPKTHSQPSAPFGKFINCRSWCTSLASQLCISWCSICHDI